MHKPFCAIVHDAHVTQSDIITLHTNNKRLFELVSVNKQQFK